MRSCYALLAALLLLVTHGANGADVQLDGEISVQRRTSSDTLTPKPPPAKKPDVKPVSASVPDTSDKSGLSTTGGSSGNTAASGGSSPGANSVSASLNVVAPAPARKGTLVFLGVAAVAGVAIAAATVPKRRVETTAHPLKGSLNRRINMFSHLANRANDHTARPPRRGEDGGYVNADDIIV